tara:strand:- start:1830 stop:2291 length:462 start_codon:yes stop_codon:yes gene_type:complete
MKKTIVTSDGYTFFIDGAGRVVDNQNPAHVDLSWNNLEHFIYDTGHFDLTVDFGSVANDMVCTARFEVNNNVTYENGNLDGFINEDGEWVADYDVVVWAWIANEESSVCDEANAVHGIKNPDELSGWIESIINEMAEDYQAGDWVAKYVGEEI